MKVSSPPGSQHAADFPEHRIRIVAPLQHQVAEDQVDAAVAQRQRWRIAPRRVRNVRSKPCCRRACAQHRDRQVERDDLRGDDSDASARELPWPVPAPRSSDDAAVQPHDIESLEQSRANLAVHGRGAHRKVRLRSVERAAHGARVEEEFVGGMTGMAG